MQLYDVLKSKSPCILLNKIIKFHKKEVKSKMENLTVLERRTLCFRAYKNCKVKVKLRLVVACKRNKRAFSVPFILSKGNFSKICVLSQCIVYWIHFQNIGIFTYQKTLPLHFCWLVLKLLKPSVCVCVGIYVCIIYVYIYVYYSLDDRKHMWNLKLWNI